MGYSHYLEQHRAATAKEWARIVAGWEVIAASCGVLLGDAWGEGAPVADGERIAFNGLGDDAHESCILTRENDGWLFCKTNRHAYDVAVVALYELAHTVAPRAYTWGTDGDGNDIAAGMELAVLALKGKAA